MDETISTEQMGWMRVPKEGKYFEIAGLPVTLKVASGESSGVCAVIEMTVPPFFSGPTAHFHRQTTEVIYVVSGSLAFTLGEETMIARPGSIVRIVPGVVHRFWNPTAEAATYLTFCAPGGIEDYLQALARLLPDPAPCSSVQMAQVLALGMEYDQFPAEGVLSNSAETC